MLRWMLCLTLVGCGLDDHPTGLGERALPGDPLGGGAEAPLQCPACERECTGGGGPPSADGGLPTSSLPELAGRGFRFETLTLTAPLPAALAGPVNQYFEDEIEAGDLHVLLHVTADDREAARLEARVGAGEAAGDGFRFTEESPLIAQLQGARLVTLEPAALSFPQPLLDPPALPMQDVYLSGDLDAGAEAWTGGLLEGVLTQADAEATTLNGQPFAVLLNALSIPPDLDTDEDGEPDAWRFTADFTAAAATIEE